jgi:hypothetical protein
MSNLPEIQAAAPQMLPSGSYRYEHRRAGAMLAIENARLAGGVLEAERIPADGLSRLTVEATLDAAGYVSRISLRYSANLFKRNATYEADGENFRGSVSAMAGRNEIVIKLGRFREVEVSGLVLFRALILAHLQARAQSRWTGRVAVLDPSTLVAASLKQNCRRADDDGRRWLYEPRMGDAEEIELDHAGCIVRRRDDRGTEAVLIAFTPAP